MNDKRRKDALSWFVEARFKTGTAQAEVEGTGWGPFMGGFKSKNDAVKQCRFERREARNDGSFRDVKFRVRGVDNDEYARLFSVPND